MLRRARVRRAVPIRATAAAGAALAILAIGPGSVIGERSQAGNLIASFNATFAPHRLPRFHLAAVAAHLDAEVSTADGSALPRVKRIEVGIAGRHLLSTRGLPVCSESEITPSTNRHALEVCGPALVGRGRFDADASIPSQAPFAIHSILYAFNARTEQGRPALLLHAFERNPPISIVLPFVVRHQSGPFPTMLVGSVPRSVGPVPHIAHIQMTFWRRFFYRGERRSYLNASCPLPRGFTVGFVSFARVIYAFAGGQRLSTEVTRSCRAR